MRFLSQFQNQGACHDLHVSLLLLAWLDPLIFVLLTITGLKTQTGQLQSDVSILACEIPKILKNNKLRKFTGEFFSVLFMQFGHLETRPATFCPHFTMSLAMFYVMIHCNTVINIFLEVFLIFSNNNKAAIDI